jgi:hypothetical protein
MTAPNPYQSEASGSSLNWPVQIFPGVAVPRQTVESYKGVSCLLSGQWWLESRRQFLFPSSGEVTVSALSVISFDPSAKSRANQAEDSRRILNACQIFNTRQTEFCATQHATPTMKHVYTPVCSAEQGRAVLRWCVQTRRLHVSNSDNDIGLLTGMTDRQGLTSAFRGGDAGGLPKVLRTKPETQLSGSWMPVPARAARATLYTVSPLGLLRYCTVYTHCPCPGHYCGWPSSPSSRSRHGAAERRREARMMMDTTDGTHHRSTCGFFFSFRSACSRSGLLVAPGQSPPSPVTSHIIRARGTRGTC